MSGNKDECPWCLGGLFVRSHDMRRCLSCGVVWPVVFLTPHTLTPKVTPLAETEANNLEPEYATALDAVNNLGASYSLALAEIAELKVKLEAEKAKLEALIRRTARR